MHGGASTPTHLYSASYSTLSLNVLLFVVFIRTIGANREEFLQLLREKWRGGLKKQEMGRHQSGKVCRAVSE